MGKPEHLTCLLRNLYASQEAAVSTGHGAMDWFKIGHGVQQGRSSLTENSVSREIMLQNWKINKDFLRQKLKEFVTSKTYLVRNV